MGKLWIGKIQVMHTSGTGNFIYILDQWSVWTHRFLEFAQILYFTGHILDEQEWFMVHFICGILHLLFAQFIPQLCAHCIFGSYIVSFFYDFFTISIHWIDDDLTVKQDITLSCTIIISVQSISKGTNVYLGQELTLGALQ